MLYMLFILHLIFSLLQPFLFTFNNIRIYIAYPQVLYRILFVLIILQPPGGTEYNVLSHHAFDPERLITFTNKHFESLLKVHILIIY